MLLERPLERIAPVDGDAGGDAVVGETAPPDHEGQGVLERLKPRQEAVPLDRDARAGRRGPRLLQVCDGALEIDDTALVPAADLDVGVDDHDGLDLRRQGLEQVTEWRRLVTVFLFVEASPAPLLQASRGSVGRAVADEPDMIAVGLEPLHELIELVLEVVYRGDDRIRPARRTGGDRAVELALRGGEIDRELPHGAPAQGGGDRGMTPMHGQAQAGIDRIGEDDQTPEQIAQVT